MAEAGLSEGIRKPGWFAPRNEKDAWKAITEAGKLPTAEDVIADPKKYQGIAADLDASDRELLKLRTTREAAEAEADKLRAAGKREEARVLENKAVDDYEAGRKAVGEKRAATLDDVTSTRKKAVGDAEGAMKSARKTNAKARASRKAKRGRILKGGLWGLGAAALGAGAALYHDRRRDEEARGGATRATALMDRAMSGEDLSEDDVNELQQSFSPETFAVIMSQRQATMDGDPSYIDQADMVDDDVDGEPAYDLPEDAPAANKMLGTALDWIFGSDTEPPASTYESGDAGQLAGWGAANAATSSAPIDIDPAEYARIRAEQGQAAADAYVQDTAVAGAANADDQGWIDIIDGLGSPDLSAIVRGEPLAPSAFGDAYDFLSQKGYKAFPPLNGLNTLSDWFIPDSYMEGGLLEGGTLGEDLGGYLWDAKKGYDALSDLGVIGQDRPGATPNAGDAERWAQEDAAFNAEQRQAPMLRSPGMDLSPDALAMLPFIEPGYDVQPPTPMDRGGLYDPVPREPVMPQMRPGPGVMQLRPQESSLNAGLDALIEPEAPSFGAVPEGPDRVRANERPPDEVIGGLIKEAESQHAPSDRAPAPSAPVTGDLTPVTVNAPDAAGPSAPPAASQGNNPGNFTTSSANLADDAADAEAQLNPINRMWRDRFGLDASERGKMARSLASFGASLASTPGSFFSAFPQAVGEGFGAWDAQTNEELARQIAEDDALRDDLLNDARIQELVSREALNDVKARVEAAKINPAGGLYPSASGSDLTSGYKDYNHLHTLWTLRFMEEGHEQDEAERMARDRLLDEGW